MTEDQKASSIIDEYQRELDESYDKGYEDGKTLTEMLE